ncbi:unnamed protein product, partial [Meganyctiphanes norvegica]
MAEQSDQSHKGKAPPPSLNKFMHPRNIYRTPPSFKQLATKYPEFRKHCTYDIKGKVHLDFKNPDALNSLTTCLLDKDFNLTVTIPPGRLVPTLPLRLNYLLWVEDLLALVKKNEALESICGMDIGTGSACVYPLLGTKQCNWSFLATETDDLNYDSAAKNIQENGLQDQIYLKKVATQTIFEGVLNNEKVTSALESCRKEAIKRKSLLPTSDLEDVIEMNKMSLSEAAEGVDTTKEKCEISGDSSYILEFMMCNPPFFSTEEDTDSMKKSKKDRGEPTSVLTGAVQELVVEGGEVAFIAQMIKESVQFKDKVRIFSTMIGSKVDVKEIKHLLSTVDTAHIAFTEFCQGRTMRQLITSLYVSQLHTVLSRQPHMAWPPLHSQCMALSLTVLYSVTQSWHKPRQYLKKLSVGLGALYRRFMDTLYFELLNSRDYRVVLSHIRGSNHKKAQRRQCHQLEAKSESASRNQSRDLLKMFEGAPEVLRENSQNILGIDLTDDDKRGSTFSAKERQAEPLMDEFKKLQRHAAQDSAFKDFKRYDSHTCYQQVIEDNDDDNDEVSNGQDQTESKLWPRRPQDWYGLLASAVVQTVLWYSKSDCILQYFYDATWSDAKILLTPIFGNLLGQTGARQLAE